MGCERPVDGRWQVVLTFAAVQTDVAPGWSAFTATGHDGRPVGHADPGIIHADQVDELE